MFLSNLVIRFTKMIWATAQLKPCLSVTRPVTKHDHSPHLCKHAMSKQVSGQTTSLTLCTQTLITIICWFWLKVIIFVEFFMSKKLIKSPFCMQLHGLLCTNAWLVNTGNVTFTVAHMIFTSKSHVCLCMDLFKQGTSMYTERHSHDQTQLHIIGAEWAGQFLSMSTS